MLRLNELVGRAVVDMDAAQKMGHVDDVVLDPEGCRVAALIVGSGQSFLGGGTRRVLDAGAVHSVGPDAVTVRGVPAESAAHLDHLPRRRDVVGRKVVGQSGKMFGHISDVLVDAGDGRILGYSMEDNPLGGLENILTGSRPKMKEYLRADADLRVGPDLVVVPDEAIVSVDAPGAASLDADRGQGGWATSAGSSPVSAWKVEQGTAQPAARRVEEEPPPPEPRRDIAVDDEAPVYEEMVPPSPAHIAAAESLADREVR